MLAHNNFGKSEIWDVGLESVTEKFLTTIFFPMISGESQTWTVGLQLTDGKFSPTNFFSGILGKSYIWEVDLQLTYGTLAMAPLGPAAGGTSGMSAETPYPFGLTTRNGPRTTGYTTSKCQKRLQAARRGRSLQIVPKYI